jgi:hypothetical protein
MQLKYILFYIYYFVLETLLSSKAGSYKLYTSYPTLSTLYLRPIFTYLLPIFTSRNTMSSSNLAVTIPRLGMDTDPLTGRSSSQTSIPAPTEAAFITQFGAHLPSAQYILSDNASTAIYELPPTVSSLETAIQRVLIVHGAGTPALGMLPLAKALQASSSNLHICYTTISDMGSPLHLWCLACQHYSTTKSYNSCSI